MAKKVLVAFVSVSGSTGEVAEAIGQVIAQTGVMVEICPVRDVVEVAGYDGLILGSSIRAGRWLPEAISFLQTHQDRLRQIPLAYFTTCMTMVNDTAENRRIVLDYIQPVLQQFPQLVPMGIGLFAGSLDPQRTLIMQIRFAPQGDYRDWAAIRDWAAEIRPRLLAEQAETETETGVVLHSALLSYPDLAGTDLSRSDLSQADLQGADLTETKLVKANLAKTDLQQAGLRWADLNKADLNQANLQGASLIGADLSEASLRRANLSQAVLNGADLSGSDLSGADLSDADLNWADLSGADLRQADLSRANLGWANFASADLDQVNMQQARYNTHTIWPEHFSAVAHGGILVGMTFY